MLHKARCNRDNQTSGTTSPPYPSSYAMSSLKPKSPDIQSEASPRPRKRPREAQSPPSPIKCPYMDTINYAALDFDLRPICSVSLSIHNVYICLSCGRYLSGRSPSTPAFTHALDHGHHLYLNLETDHVYSLPDAYRVEDPSLPSIILAHRPTFTPATLLHIDRSSQHIRLLDNSTRLRGIVPLNNLPATDYISVITQLLIRITPIRDFLLLHTPAAPTHSHQSALIAALALIARKLWADHAFRDHVSPHHLVHLIADASNAIFSVTKQADPVSFLAWILQTLCIKSAPKSSVNNFARLLKHSCRGKMTVTDTMEDGTRTSAETPFWFLSLDLPPTPLFNRLDDRALVPQIPLTNLLRKFNGISKHHVLKSGTQRTYKLTDLPQYLFLVIRRFTKSKFGTQKNSCVVHLPPNSLQMREIAPQIEGNASYKLIAAVLHDGPPNSGHYRIAIYHKASKQWFELNDTKVKATHFHLVSLADTYILLYEHVEDA